MAHPPSGRVVVTGLGAVTPLGLSVEDTWQGIVAGRSGIDRITQIDPSPYTTQIAGEVKDFDAAQWMDRKEARRVDRVIAFAVASAAQALKDSGLVFDDELRDETGVYIGSGVGGLWTMQEQTHNLYEKGANKVSPFYIPYMIPNMPGGMVSILAGGVADFALKFEVPAGFRPDRLTVSIQNGPDRLPTNFRLSLARY